MVWVAFVSPFITSAKETHHRVKGKVELYKAHLSVFLLGLLLNFVPERTQAVVQALLFASGLI